MKERYVVFEVKVISYVYDSGKTCYHNICVKPYPIKTIYDNGKYIDKKGNRLDVNNYRRSYATTSDNSKLDNVKDRFMGKGYEKKEIINSYGFPTPLSDYKKSKEVIAKIKEGIIPNNYIRLSSNKEEALKQLKQIGIKTRNKKTLKV